MIEVKHFGQLLRHAAVHVPGPLSSNGGKRTANGLVHVLSIARCVIRGEE